MERRRVRAHVASGMKIYKILRACRVRGDGLRHAGQAIARMCHLAITA